jgi:hypothetical protein
VRGTINILAWLLLLTPLAFSASLTWQEYLRVGGLAIGLGYGVATRFMDRLPSGGEKVVVVVGSFIILSQLIYFPTFLKPYFAQGGGSVLPFVLSFLALVAASIAFFALNAWKWKPNLLDWVVVVVGWGLFLLFMILKFAFTEAIAWPRGFLPAGFVTIWLISRQFHSLPDFEWEKYRTGLVSVFFVVSLMGCLTIGRAYYYSWSAVRDMEKSDLEEALQQYATLEGLSQRLKLESLYNESLLGQARVHHRQGLVEKAYEILSMGSAFRILVAPNEWEGPVGGMLYKNTSCWVDLKLYAGKIQVDVFARGQPAQGSWPRMRVRLGGKILGEVDVVSMETKPYHFLAENHSRQARLEISFLNDLWQSGVWDRSLYIEQAEIIYKEVDW